MRVADTDVTVAPDAVDLRILILAAFEFDGLADETDAWQAAYDFERTHPVPGVPVPLRVTDDGMGLVVTGMGTVAAATTVAAIEAAPSVDTREATVLTVGIAGGPPERTTVGDVCLADRVVDWDYKQRWNGTTDADGEDTYRPLPYRAHDPVWTLDDERLGTARRVAEGVELADSTDAAAVRRRYADAGATERTPEVRVGTTVAGSEFWAGADIAAAVEDLLAEYGAGTYLTTEMEGAGVAAALERFGRLDHYLSVRAVSNFDRPAPGEFAPDGLYEDGDVALAAENAFRVGSALVEAILDDPTTGRRGTDTPEGS